MPIHGWADANDFATYWNVDIEEIYEAQVNRLLDMASSNIYAALQAAGAGSCSMDDWATTYLKNLNVILGAVLYYAPCWPHLSVEEKRLYMEFANGQLTEIKNGTLELCSGATGKDFPSIDWAEQSVDEFSAAKIIVKDL
jgi:hypothetical protein